MPSTLTQRPPWWSPWRPRTDAVPRAVAARPRPALVAGIKAFHTLAWLSIESCVIYVLHAGLRGRTDKHAAIAGGIIAGEVLVFAGNRFRCPLTELAERYGAPSGSVTDIYLPKWFAHNMPVIHAPLLVLMMYLHARNLVHVRGSGVRILSRPGVLPSAETATVLILRAVQAFGRTPLERTGGLGRRRGRSAFYQNAWAVAGDGPGLTWDHAKPLTRLHTATTHAVITCSSEPSSSSAVAIEGASHLVGCS